VDEGRAQSLAPRNHLAARWPKYEITSAGFTQRVEGEGDLPLVTIYVIGRLPVIPGKRSSDKTAPVPFVIRTENLSPSHPSPVISKVLRTSLLTSKSKALAENTAKIQGIAEFEARNIGQVSL
jgi:hypothetical protein